MPSDFDQSEFVDSDVLAPARPLARPVTMSQPSASRPPSREELDLKVSDAQQQLAIDGLTQRLVRIERRLELRDA